jgi:hypothetical protein
MAIKLSSKAVLNFIRKPLVIDNLKPRFREHKGIQLLTKTSFYYYNTTTTNPKKPGLLAVLTTSILHQQKRITFTRLMIET